MGCSVCDDHGDNLDHHVGDDLTSRALTVLDLRFESFPSTSCSGRPVGMEASTWWALNQSLIMVVMVIVHWCLCFLCVGDHI